MTTIKDACRYTFVFLTFFFAIPLNAQPMTDDEFGLVYAFELTKEPRAASRYFQNIENAVLKTRRFQGLDHSQFTTRVPPASEVFRKAILEESRAGFSDIMDFILNPSIGVGVPIAPGTVLGYSVSLNSPVFSDVPYSSTAKDRLADVRKFLSENPELAKIADEHANAQLGHSLDVLNGDSHYAVLQARRLIKSPDQTRVESEEVLEELKTVSGEHAEIVNIILNEQAVSRKQRHREAELQAQRQELKRSFVILGFVVSQLGDDTSVTQINYLLSGLQPLISQALERHALEQQLLRNPSALADVALAVQIFQVFQTAISLGQDELTIEQIILLEIQKLKLEMNQRFDVIEKILGAGFSDILRGQNTIRASLADIESQLESLTNEVALLRTELAEASRDEVLIGLNKDWSRCHRIRLGTFADYTASDIDACTALYTRLSEVSSSRGATSDSALHNRLFSNQGILNIDDNQNRFGDWQLRLWLQSTELLLSFNLEHGDREQISRAANFASVSLGLLRQEIISEQDWSISEFVPEEAAIFLSSKCSSFSLPSSCPEDNGTPTTVTVPNIAIKYFSYLDSLHALEDTTSQKIQNQTISAINPWNPLEDFDRPVLTPEKVNYCQNGYSRQNLSLDRIVFSRQSFDKIRWQKRDATQLLSRQSAFDPSISELVRKFAFRAPTGWDRILRSLPDERLRLLWAAARFQENRIGRITLCYSFFQYNPSGSWEIRGVNSHEPRKLTTEFDLKLHVGFQFSDQSSRTSEVVTYHVPLAVLSKRYSFRPSVRPNATTRKMERGSDRFMPLHLEAIDSGEIIRSKSANGRHDSSNIPFYEDTPLSDWSGGQVSVSYPETSSAPEAPSSILHRKMLNRIEVERSNILKKILLDETVRDKQEETRQNLEKYSDSVLAFTGMRLNALTARFIYRLPQPEQLITDSEQERHGYDHFLRILETGGYVDSELSHDLDNLDALISKSKDAGEMSAFSWFLRSLGWR